MQIKHFLLFSALLLSGSLWGQIPSGYYDSANGKTGQELRAALHNIIKGHTTISYSGLLNAYAYTDSYSDSKIWDIYTNIHWSQSNSCGNYSGEGDCWNREHTWPQSWFKEQSTPRCDLFHVMPTDGYVNGMRSNYPYGEVQSATYTSGNGSKLGTCKTDGYSGTVFEPIDEYKGDIARNFFYMTTRYYGEDSSWGSSDMTNKCEIEDWAIKMLLRWHELDPVSDKETARNNVIYASYQHNRNPFIDHPEYAEMIWDEDWEAGTSYNITSATNLSGGTVSAPYSALEGATVSITATPNAGYAVSGYSAWKTGDTSTTVDVSSNGTFTMPGYAVTVSATFEKDNTQYSIALASTTNGTISASDTTALSGTTITITTTPADGYSLYSLYVYKTGDVNTVVEVTDNSFVMPAYNVTVSATFVEESSTGGTGDFVKVTSAPDDWSGEYLIVCESYNVVFNGTVASDWGRCSDVTINSNTIEANATTNSYVVTISPSGSGYKVLLPSGKYMNWTSEKKFSEDSSHTTYSMSLSGEDVSIAYGNYAVRYNSAGGLRSYGPSSGQQSIQLYKRTTSTAPAVTHTITFHGNDESQVKTQEVEEFVPTALTPNTFTLDGYVFDGWQDASGKYYADGAEVTLIDDLTLYALWDKLYTVSCATGLTGGTISASHTSALEETTIELTATPEDGYLFKSWTVTNEDGESITVNDNTFEMPASNVTVSATFVKTATGKESFVKVTSAPDDWSGTYLIVYEKGSLAFDGGLTVLDDTYNSISVTINNDTIEANDTTKAATFTLAPMKSGTTSGYSIQAKSGIFIGNTSSSNGLSTNADSPLLNTLSYSNGETNVKSSSTNTITSTYLKFNSQSSQMRFRYYTSTQQSIQLYKLISEPVVLGDVNYDDEVTIADVTALVNIILGKDDEEPYVYNHVAADVNVDESITIADVTALVNIILGKTE